jgi:hypothetical protein
MTKRKVTILKEKKGLIHGTTTLLQFSYKKLNMDLLANKGVIHKGQKKKIIVEKIKVKIRMGSPWSIN